jgi:hypothetical protein
MSSEPVDLDLDAAMAAVLKEAYRDEVPDVIRHADFRLAWPEVKAELEACLSSGDYQPRHPRIVEVPKSALATRPMAVLDLRDRVLYEAIMQELGPNLDGELVEEVKSARLRKTKAGRWVTTEQVRAWVTFQKEGRELCDHFDNVCLLTTDITSYFEFIDLDILIRDLRAVPGINLDLVNLLARLLRGMATQDEMHGVPQGPDVSSILGNFYLRPLDAILRKMDVRFLRFQDDIKVFANEPHELRIAVRDLMPVIRGRHLNLSTVKTKILQGEAVEDHFADSGKDAIQYGLATGAAGAKDALRDLFDRAVEGELNERDIRFAVHRLSQLGDDYAVAWILDHLAEVPYLSSILVRYLSAHWDNDPSIESRVVAFLGDSRLNISPFVEGQLIRMLATAPSVQQPTYDLLWRTLMNPQKDSRVRQFAARAVGRHIQPARSGDVEVLRGMMGRFPDDTPLRRAILVGLLECGDADKGYLDAISRGDPALRHTCRYLRAKPTLPPP